MDILSAIFRQQSRRIGLLIPSVVVSEKHSDALEITEHPLVAVRCWTSLIHLQSASAPD